MNSEVPYHRFAAFWNKYRPAILKMMQGSLNEWQEYQFMKHELNAVEKRPKGGFNFRVVISMSKASLDSKDSEIGRDFIDMLKLSQTGSALIAANRYEIVLEKNQMLRINRQSIS